MVWKPTIGGLYREGVLVETDPIFSAWLLATPPLYVETDPIFAAWLLATPPVYPAALASYVPYTGATGNVNLGVQTLIAGTIVAVNPTFPLNSLSTYIDGTSAGWDTAGVSDFFAGVPGTTGLFSLRQFSDPLPALLGINFDDLGSFALNYATGRLTSTFPLSAPNCVSSVITGTSPYACTSTTLNTNLNADLLDGQHGAYYAQASLYVPYTGATGNVDLGAHNLTDAGNVSMLGLLIEDPTAPQTVPCQKIIVQNHDANPTPGGTYLRIADYSGFPCYEMAPYYMWADGSYGYIGQTLGDITDCWYCYYGFGGYYYPNGAYSGNPRAISGSAMIVQNGMPILAVGANGYVNFWMGGAPSDDFMFYIREDRGSMGLMYFEGGDGGVLRIDTFPNGGTAGSGHTNLDNYCQVDDGANHPNFFIGRDMVGGFVWLGGSDSKGLKIPTGGHASDDIVSLNTIKSAGYKSSDGSAGVSTTITTASLVGKTITVKNGLITSFA